MQALKNIMIRSQRILKYHNKITNDIQRDR